MVQSAAKTVKAYLAELPQERRAVVAAVREVILKHLDHEFAEGIQYGMLGYFVPHAVYPPGYHCDPKQPLPYIALAAQKNYYSLYLMSAYGEGPHWNWFREAWAATGKKLDMGKCCLRFKSLDDLALPIIADAISRVTAREYIARYEQLLGDYRATKKPVEKTGVTKKTAKKSSVKKKAVTKKAKPTKKSSLARRVRSYFNNTYPLRIPRRVRSEFPATCLSIFTLPRSVPPLRGSR